MNNWHRQTNLASVEEPSLLTDLRCYDVRSLHCFTPNHSQSTAKKQTITMQEGGGNLICFMIRGPNYVWPLFVSSLKLFHARDEEKHSLLPRKWAELNNLALATNVTIFTRAGRNQKQTSPCVCDPVCNVVAVRGDNLRSLFSCRRRWLQTLYRVNNRCRFEQVFKVICNSPKHSQFFKIFRCVSSFDRDAL